MSKLCRIPCLVALVAVVILAGCGTARYIERTPTGGTLALDGDPDKANKEAKRLMVDHCKSGGYKVLYEGRAVIGTESERRQETRTSYQCKTPPPPVAQVVDAPDAGQSQ